MPSAFIFLFFHLGDRAIASFYGWLDDTTDKLLNHGNKGMPGLFPGVIGKRIVLLYLLPMDDQLLP